MQFLAKLIQAAAIVLLLSFFFNGQASAADPASFSADTLKETSSLFEAVLKVSGALALVVALMVLLIYLIKKTGLNPAASKAGSLIKILETRMVAQKKYIAIVEIAGKCVALGITDHNINMLTSLEDAPDADQILLPERQEKNMSFEKILHKVKTLSKRNVSNDIGEHKNDK